MKQHIIYISGLGDHYDGVRSFFLSLWRIYGVRTELLPMKWSNNESFDEKAARIHAAIEKAHKKGYQVSLIGESAGASMALNVRATNQAIQTTVSLCGVNTSRTPIARSILKSKPAFAMSVQRLDESRAKVMRQKDHKVVVITARRDPSVPVRINRIEGATHRKVFSVGHITTILLCLTVYSPIVIRAIKRS